MSALLLRAQRKPDEDANQYLTISLEPSDRAALHARIEQRFDAMLAQGLIDEVRAPRAATCIPACPSVRCVGYRQMWAHLDGEIDLAGAREQGIAATRQLAKRQITCCGRSLSVSSSIAWRGTRWRARSTRWPPRWANAPDTSTGLLPVTDASPSVCLQMKSPP